MGDKSKIEWCDATWNPVTGCSPVSPACDHCYAARMVKRFPHLHYMSISHNSTDKSYVIDRTIPYSKIMFHPDRLDIPLRWRKPRRIFVCSMGDLFHEGVDYKWIDAVFRTIQSCPQHTFLFLTKRPHEMRLYMHADQTDDPISKNGWPPPNVFLGVTAENQEMADQRIPILLQTPAAVRFVSVEPMLEPVDLKRVRIPNGFIECSGGRLPGLDWVICGGETGPGARPMHPDWPRSLRNQCQAAGVPFFFKQWGETIHTSQMPDWLYREFDACHPGESGFCKVGKKAAGCLLDGKEWKQFPKEAL